MRSAGLATVVVVLAVAAAVALHAAPQIDPSEIQLQAAVNKATVEGDLKGAILEFQKILNTRGVSRPVAAKALLQLGQCHEKLGTVEARRSYERILKDFADQGDVVHQARERLATLAKAAPQATGDALKGRRIIGPLYHLRVAASPDGRYLAYCCSAQAPNGLVVHDVQTGRDLTIAAPVEAAPVFSPDALEIAYVAQKLGESPELRVVKRTGADDRVILKQAAVTGIALFGWMPNGQDLLVRLARKDTPAELALVPVAGGAPRTVASPPPYTGPAGNNLSPDGKYLAYRVQVGPGSPWVTRVFSLETGADAPLVDRPANAWTVGWTGDSRFAFYSADRESEGIWAVKVADGKAQGLPERMAGRLDESFQPVGVSRSGAFFYQKQILDFNVRLMSIAPGSGALRESRVLAGTQSPDWSPDGRSLAYAQTGSGLVRIETLATGATRTLWTGLPGAIMSLKWYPDQSALAAQGVGPEGGMGSVGLRRVDLASGALADIVLGRNWAEFGANPSFSADGKSVTYKAFDPARQATTLTRYDMETRAKNVLMERKPPAFVSGFSVSPNTGQIAVAVIEQNQPSSLGLLDPTSGEFRIIHRTEPGDFIPANLSVAWMPDGKSLLFLTAPGATNGVPMSLHRVAVSGGQPEKLFEAEMIFQVRVHPDGGQIALETRSYKFETLVADKLFAAATK